MVRFPLLSALYGNSFNFPIFRILGPVILTSLPISLVKESWVVDMRERIGNKFVRLVDRYTTHLKKQGQDQKAIGCCLAALDLSPMSENLYLKLMLLYEKTGQRGEAFAVGCRYRRILDAAFGIEPGNKILELCERLKEPAKPCTSVPIHLSGK